MSTAGFVGGRVLYTPTGCPFREPRVLYSTTVSPTAGERIAKLSEALRECLDDCTDCAAGELIPSLRPHPAYAAPDGTCARCYAPRQVLKLYGARE